MIDHVELRSGLYRDSVALMLLTRTLSQDNGISDPIVAMATTLNMELARTAGYEIPEGSGSELLIAFRAEEEAISRCLQIIDDLLNQSQDPTVAHENLNHRPRSLGRLATDWKSDVALVSVPGEHAAYQAVEAIEAGAHPVIFSDNVSIKNELSLKKQATDLGLLVMGPDCGTVILDGVGLGFANVIPAGPIGLISASGTGAQQVLALCDHAGVGVRHVLGLGGRDLTDEIGGISAHTALTMLEDDPTVEVIGIVAKEVGPSTRESLEDAASKLSTPVVWVPTGDLTNGTDQLLEVAGFELRAVPVWRPAMERPNGSGRLVGLFSGGTLAIEAQAIAQASGCEAEIVDLGADEYTVGRPHPMIDNTLRLERLAEMSRDETVGTVLLDVVLGHGASPDPAAELQSALRDISVPIFVSLIGTNGDPQNFDSQVNQLTQAGAEVHLSNASAARAAVIR
ncbi:MAG: FdrA family protein [Acidimicrobiales bacterium MED-G01]|nr:MAG: FdrA family protein [Acidimicrobiales bacterium MED-G01]